MRNKGLNSFVYFKTYVELNKIHKQPTLMIIRCKYCYNNFSELKQLESHFKLCHLDIQQHLKIKYLKEALRKFCDSEINNNRKTN